MPNLRLTDTICKKLPAPPARHQIYYDDEVPGFGLCVTRNNARSFVIRYRRKRDGVERSMVIGDFPTWSTAQARQRAKELRRDIDVGADPLASIEQARSEPTLAEVVERDFAELKRRASTLRTWRNQLDADILPEMGKRKIGSITVDEVAKLHRRIVDRGSPVAANRTIMNLSGILSRAIERGERAEPNPVHAFVKQKKMSKEQKRERYLSPAESARFRAALDGEADRQAVNALKLIWLTGARAGETLQSRWADFDLTEGRWKKPRHSTKGDQDHGVPLSEAAVALLRAMHQHRDQTSPFVFPATSNKGERSHRRRIDRARERILKAAGIGDLRTHDLRHDFATIVHDAGAPLAVVGRLLGHRDLRSTARYAHATEARMRSAVEQAANAIVGVVVPLCR
jgi:integrase